MKLISLFPDMPAPKPADGSLGGTIPLRAYQYCTPLVEANAFGSYLFPPVNVSLQWDGKNVFWSYGDLEEWYLLQDAQLPYVEEYYSGTHIEQWHKYLPPFLTALPEAGYVQIWSGYVVKTQPMWSTLIRMPANVPQNPAFQIFEGLVETDWWCGPLITNIRVIEVNKPIKFKTDIPYLQVTPVHRDSYASKEVTIGEFLEDPLTLEREFWQEYTDLVLRKSERGYYAKEVRRRRKK